jgi:hypothetical protein
MKIILSVIIVVLMIGTPSAYAQVIHFEHPQADYQSGFKHGVADASDQCKDPRVPCLAYVWKSPNGFINQTDDFIDGYVTGFCKIAGPDASMEEPEADFWCKDGSKVSGLDGRAY